VEEEKELMRLDLELFFGAFTHLIQTQWIALVVIITGLIVDLALTSKERCEHSITHEFQPLPSHAPVVVQPDGMALW